MRLFASSVAAVLAASLTVGCGTTSYEIKGSELQRLASLPPEARGQSVRVTQQLTDADVGPPVPVTSETQIVIFPRVVVVDDDWHRRREVSGWGPAANAPRDNQSGGVNVGNAGDHINTPNSGHSGGGGHGGGGVNLGGTGGSDGKAAAVAILILASVALVVAAGVEGSRYDGYVQLHPMHPLYLVGQDGSRAVMPLAWLDPQSAAFADKAYIRSEEGPWNELGRAPLDRQGFTYSVFGGLGTYQSSDGTKDIGPATTIQFGYFPEQHIGIVGSLFMGWRQNTFNQTLFESRYTVEAEFLPVHAGPIHFGLYGGGGGAHRFEDGVNGSDSSLAVLGGGMVQLDFNTRLALTARLGQTYGHGELMSDALIGLAVY